MKKFLSFILAAVIVFSFAGCSSKEAKNDKTESTTKQVKAEINITESTYVTYINDIYQNPDFYIGKVISMQGMYTYEVYEGKKYYYVFRQGPGCCGNDGSMCGLEFTSAKGYPDYTPKDTDKNEDHPWISVTGTLDQYYEGDAGPYYTLKNATYEVLPDSERGAYIVSL